MGRTTKILTFSLPPEIVEKIERLAKKEGRSRSELLRAMVETYEEQMAEKEWRELFSFGEETARRFGLKSEEELFKILNETK